MSKKRMQFATPETAVFESAWGGVGWGDCGDTVTGGEDGKRVRITERERRGYHQGGGTMFKCFFEPCDTRGGVNSCVSKDGECADFMEVWELECEAGSALLPFSPGDTGDAGEPGELGEGTPGVEGDVLTGGVGLSVGESEET